jgi:hypothetical protein
VATSDVFVEFTLSLNSLTEQLSQQHLPGLVRACQELENTALSLFGDSSTHPITDEEADAIEHQLGIILQPSCIAMRRRRSLHAATTTTAKAAPMSWVATARS